MNELRRLQIMSSPPDNGRADWDPGQAKKVWPGERVALPADHLLYGFILSELRRRPQG